MNKGAQVLGESTRQVGKQLHELEKHCNHFCRLLEHAVWEEDMVHEELIVFTGSTQEFLKLLEPLLRSNHCKVNGKNNREALLRVIDSVIKYRVKMPGSISNSSVCWTPPNVFYRKSDLYPFFTNIAKKG